jgi:acyl-CoA thioesterase I
MFRVRVRGVVLLLSVLITGACNHAACGDLSGGITGSPQRSASGQPTGNPDPATPPARPKIVVLGDSITAGYGLLESQAYPALLQKYLDADGYAFEVVNAGISGDTSAGGLRRLDWALDGNVRVLILELGANDGLRGLSVPVMKENLTTIITRAKERNIVVILAGMEAPPNYGPEYVRTFRSAFQDIAREQRVLFIPFLLDKVAGQTALNQADGIHPNADGARIVADTVWSVLRTLLDQMAGTS